jgi:UDP-N-acetylmuramoyl-L-alanyl-D-glutamate--2,6-diaminopimelate ligase
MIIAGVDISKLTGLTQDSRKVEPGFLFAAFPGVQRDGRAYIQNALEQGASVILALEGTVLPAGANAQLITDANPRRLFAQIAAAFYERQPAHIAAVTGTNGKTSVSIFLAHIWAKLGYESASMGTLGIYGSKIAQAGSMTTPDTVTLHKQLAELAQSGVSHLAMEASSHGLDQYRLDGVKIVVAGFTNLSHDHLDYHSSMEAYFAAKARLFSEVLLSSGTAVLNADTPEFSTLEKICYDRGVRVISYGSTAREIKILSAQATGHGQNLKLEIFGTVYDLFLPLVGYFQAMNALCALGMAIALDEGRIAEALKALQTLPSAPGRLQKVTGHPSGAAIYIDYAHTPDALETVLKALRPHTARHLVCVFGCGGDRDAGKRSVMGKIAARLADQVIITDDNPRSENPETIRAMILSAANGAVEIGNRHSAIQTAIQNLQAGDVLLIAGKGHEQGQIFKDKTEPFDDVQEAVRCLQLLRS